MARTVHVIGAGLSGLSAALRLTARGARVIVHEAMQQAGGRARSYYDAATGLVIDNGNHLLLSGNHAAMAYVRALGSEAGLVGPPQADFAFIDLPSNKRWTLRINDGRLPWWMLDEHRRVPGSTLADYLRLLPLVWAGRSKTVGETIACRGPVYDRLAHPLLLAALNTDPPQGSAALAGAIMRETLMAGGRACRPLIARGLTEVLIDPALRLLAQRGADVRFGAQLRALDLRDDRVQALDLGGDRIVLGEGDAAILAVPPWIAPSLVPGLSAPSQFRAIVNAHFRIAPRKDFPPMIGVLGATVEWIFAFPDRLSVTISRRGPPARPVARGTGRADLARGRAGRRDHRGSAAVAGGARAACHIRRDAGRGRQTPRCRHEILQSLPSGRLDRHGLARDHRRCHSIRQPGSRSGAARLKKTTRWTIKRPFRRLRRRTRSMPRWKQKSAPQPTRCWPTSSRTDIGCSSSKPTPRSRPNTC
jgi:hypothetical protein